MCRWMAYSGGKIQLDELLFKAKHNLIDQSMSSRSAETPTNADGFGLGWYGRHPRPGLFRSIRPAWNDFNLRDLVGRGEPEPFPEGQRGAVPRPETVIQSEKLVRGGGMGELESGGASPLRFGGRAGVTGADLRGEVDRALFRALDGAGRPGEGARGVRRSWSRTRGRPSGSRRV